MRDAIEMEWAGIPSVALINDKMGGSANSIKRLSGTPDYEFITVAHPHIPTVVWTDDEIREVAREVAPQVIASLTRNGG